MPNFTQIEDALHDFIMVATGLDADMIRPEYSTANAPDVALDWAVFSIRVSKVDNFNNALYNRIDEQEKFSVTVSFFGNNSYDNSSNFRTMCGSPEKRRLLLQADLRLMGFDELRRSPVLVNELWQQRWDIDLQFSRHKVTKLDTPLITSASVTLIVNK